MLELGPRDGAVQNNFQRLQSRAPAAKTIHGVRKRDYWNKMKTITTPRGLMATELESWERNLEKLITEIDLPLRHRAGALLPVIPDRLQWEDFTASVKAEWTKWCTRLITYPHCLVVLYGGVAFYEYDENKLWPQFAKTVGDDSLSGKGYYQHEINVAFEHAAQSLGLTTQERENGTDFVGSAVYHIGIPLSLWDDFLEICEWALWREDWKTLESSEWTEVITKRTTGRPRLRKFSIDNREGATATRVTTRN